jgi:hypothetical protein
VRSIIAVVVYHTSLDIEQIIPELETVLGFALGTYKIIPDERDVYYVAYWSDLMVPDDFQPSDIRRRFHNLISNAHLSIIEHKRSWWEKWGMFFGIAVSITAVIMGSIAVYLAYHPPNHGG